MTTISVAILDDFQNVTRTLADWGRLPPHVSVTVFNDHVEGETLVGGSSRSTCSWSRASARRSRAACRATAEFEARRHRGHAQSRHRSCRLPRARRARLRHGIGKLAHSGARVGSHPRAGAPHPRRRPLAACGHMAEDDRRRFEGQDARGARSRPPRHAGGACRARLRHEGDRLEPEPDGRARRRSRLRPRREGRSVPHGGCSDDPSAAERPHARHRRTRRARADEAERVPRQHRTRGHRGRAGADRCANDREDRRRRVWMCSDASPCPPMHRSCARPTPCSRRIWATSRARPTTSTSRKRSKTSKPGSPANPSASSRT